MSYDAIVIAGPTGVGKTNLSLKLAKFLNAEIISADSMQIYKGLDIGTAKIKENEMLGIKHHMLDIIEADEEYSVGDYEKRVNEILNSNKKNYLIVGGTGLYIDAITEGISNLPSKDIKLREKLESMDLEDLLIELKTLDEDKYNKIDKKNKVRVVRAVEILKLSNNSFNDIFDIKHKNNDYNFLKVFLTRDREELYNLINKRVDIMIENNLENEARIIFEKYPFNKSIAYKEMFDYFLGNMTFLEAINLIKQKSRNYAKRQETWFRKRKDYIKYNLSQISEDEIIIDIINKFRNGV